MKNLFTIFCLLFASVLFGQATINIDGFVVDPAGNPVENVTITIVTDSIAGTVYYNQVLTDATGYFSDSFTVPSNQTQGAVYVIMENCPGVPNQTATLFFNPGNNDFSLAFVYCDTGNACSVDILSNPVQGTTSIELSAAPGGQAPFTYIWSSGQNTPSIIVSQSGTYCVSIADANGCTATDCEIVIIDPPVDSCGVDIELTPAGALAANAYGEAPISYSWNTGDSSSVIFPNAPGDYCVTVTDAAGCVATDCYYYSGGGGDTLCSVWINVLGAGTNQLQLEAVADGEVPYTYLWSTNETTAIINATQSGTYCVTVTDNTGCIAEECVTVQLPPVDNFQISGNVWLADSLNVGQESGLAYLITYDPNSGWLEAVDSVALSASPFDLSYDFGVVPAGDYRVKVALDPASPSYSHTMPTYHSSYLFWDEADVITVPYSGQSWFNVYMIEGTNPGGPGFIGGYVSNGANFWQGTPKGGVLNGDPMGAVSVLLLNEFDQAVAHVVTDASGRFEFENLPWGTYQVIVEIIGVEHAINWVTIGPDNPSVDNITFEVNDNTITTDVQEASEQVSVQVFPNPAGNQLQAVLQSKVSASGQLEILNTQGQVLYARNIELFSGENVYPVDLSGWSSGMYLLRIQSEAGLAVQRIVKR